MNILQETSYQSPVEVLFYLLGLGKCNPKRLFRPVGDQGCHERELRVLHKYSSSEGASPYLQLKELSKIYTEIIYCLDYVLMPHLLHRYRL